MHHVLCCIVECHEQEYVRRIVYNSLLLALFIFQVVGNFELLNGNAGGSGQDPVGGSQVQDDDHVGAIKAEEVERAARKLKLGRAGVQM